jgi:hypothetical protein
MTAFFIIPFSARRMNRLGGSQFFQDSDFVNNLLGASAPH